MAKAVRETKGPIGEEAPHSDGATIAHLLAAQAKMGELLTQMGPLLVTTAAKHDTLEQRVERAEQALLALAGVMRQMHLAFQEVLTARRF